VPRMRVRAPLAIVVGAILLRLRIGIGFANYDTLYSLVWGQQLARGQTDKRSDQYSIGLILYRSLTGRMPEMGGLSDGKVAAVKNWTTSDKYTAAERAVMVFSRGEIETWTTC